MTHCDDKICTELLQNGHNTSDTNTNNNNSANSSRNSCSNDTSSASTGGGRHSPDSPNKVPPGGSPKCALTIGRRSFIYGTKRRRVDKFYRKQSSLVENFEQDSKQIQTSQQRRLNSPNSIEMRRNLSADSQNFASIDAVHLVENGGGGGESADEFDDSTVSRLLEPTPILAIKSVGNGTMAMPKVRIFRSAESLRHIARRRPSAMSTTTESTSSKTLQARASRRLALLSLLVNLALTLAKAAASVMSGSLSIISSLVDSCVDITSGFVIWLTGRAIRKHDPYLYPVGRTRLEPVALVIVSVIMAVASVQMIVQSLEAVISERINPRVDWPTIAIMVATVVVKLILFLLCRRQKDSSSTRVLAQDHRNDCLSNSVALLCAFGAQKFWLYLDPIGAILVSLYIAITWYRTGKEHLIMLSGRSAKPAFINRIIKVCIDHDKRIKFIDTVFVYHFGLRFLVEVHIGLDVDMRLKEAHDIAESLQNSIESLPDVERAFLHVDYEFEHKPQDEHKVP
uniref:Cation efflux protein cytoplasmic domain-containing protein n=1 Tax=Globodera rostochiensis TaxID=31243 RepID=A0A914HMZ5_GLORO